ncbi:hypothetical protein GTO91_16950 [Heliobacterium undosum]|uniref:Uncharacterized protein n=1 Tax=Heliomicrobium undosum TaxID=121734 RepID=A0A845L9T4_9FIRM|nr:hypothetical protein [Heliomicrobium undosum]MZP31390.1 hypothetical protein [Heliomicrobium undosum]
MRKNWDRLQSERIERLGFKRDGQYTLKHKEDNKDKSTVRRYEPISISQRNLLINSEVTKDLPWLFELLKYNKSIINAKLNDLPTDQRSFFIERKQFPVVLAAEQEWIGDPYPVQIYDERVYSCELCGTKIQKLYLIKNIKNSNQLYVGCECIEKYVSGALASMGGKSAIIKADLERRRLNRMLELEENIPGLQEMLNWTPKDYRIIPPKKMHIDFNKIQSDGVSLVNQYVKKKSDRDQIIKLLKEWFFNAEEQRNKIELYILQWENHPLAATKEIIKWLKEHLKERDSKEIIDIIEKNGCITTSTIEHILEHNFLEKVSMPIIRQALDNTGFLIEPNHELRMFNIIDKTNRELFLSLQMSLLINFFRNQISKQRVETIYAEQIIAILQKHGVIVEDMSIQKFLEHFSYYLNVFGYKVSFWNKAYNEAFIWNNKERRFWKVELRKLLKGTKTLYFYRDREDIKVLASWVEGMSTLQRLERVELLNYLKEKSSYINNWFNSLMRFSVEKDKFKNALNEIINVDVVTYVDYDLEAMEKNRGVIL